MEDIELRDFEITYAIENDLHVEQFTIGNKLTELLNKKLNLQDYCKTITSLFVIFQCFAPDNKYVQVKELLKFKRKTKVIELYLLLDYEQVKKADKKAILQLLAEAYKLGISLLSKHKGFNTEKFQKEVAILFNANSIL